MRAAVVEGVGKLVGSADRHRAARQAGAHEVLDYRAGGCWEAVRTRSLVKPLIQLQR